MKRITILQIFNNLLLAFLLFLFLYVITIDNIPKTYLRYNIPSDDINDLFSGQRAIEKFQQQYIIKTLHLTGDYKKDNLVQQKFAELLKKESLRPYAIIIYRIYLPKELPYSRFIALLNLMQTEGYKRYMEWDNYFYVLTNNNKFRL